MKSKLERLYAKRLKLDRDRLELNRQIALLESQGQSMAAYKIHHATDGCSRPRHGSASKGAHKITRNWKLVDCLSCHRYRGHNRRAKKKPRVPWKTC